ncbi:MAG TPA: co-chaperone GroES [Solirubrobacteraceae bacterium]|nr:co-chaperone GroES [Solirubrobacteraceae bacterium]
MSEEIQPLGGRVLVRILQEQTVTSSGIVLPDTAREKPQRGEVVAVGDEDDLIKVAPGDLVLYPKYTGTEITVDGEDHLILEATDLLAVIRTSPAQALAA